MEPKPKKVNFQIVVKTDAAWSVLTKALKYHTELRDAEVGLAWRKATKEDVDGRIVLGRCVKMSDLQKEFIHFDFIIVLNREFWDSFSDEQRLALMDHELCHAAIALDKDSEPRVDERDRQVYRMRKHDIEEFREVVERHGCYKSDLEAFAKVIRRKTNSPLFDEDKTTVEVRTH